MKRYFERLKAVLREYTMEAQFYGRLDEMSEGVRDGVIFKFTNREIERLQYERHLK